MTIAPFDATQPLHSTNISATPSDSAPVTTVLIVHPRLAPIGGAEQVGLLFAGAVLDLPATEVTMLTLTAEGDALDAVGADRWRELQLDRLRWIRPRPSLPMRIMQGRTGLFDLAYATRCARGVAGSFDVCVSTFNELDFGRRGIQYVHAPLHARRDVLRRYEIIPPDGRFYRPSLLEIPYDFLLKGVSRQRPSGVKSNVTLVNSAFMRDVVREAYGIDSEVVYPPVAGLSEGYRMEGRRDPTGFVSVGRISPDKHVDRLLPLFAAIHGRLPDARLTVVGHAPDRDYLRRFEAMIAESGLPIEVRKDASERDVWHLLQGSTYFISPKPYEHFGISVVEAVRAGCLPLVYAAGGVTEIVPAEELQYLSAADLARKVGVLAESSERRDVLLDGLRSGLDRFSEERFRRRVQEIVLEFGRGRGGG